MSQVAFPSQPVWGKMLEERLGLVFWYLWVYRSVGSVPCEQRNDWFEVESCLAT